MREAFLGTLDYEVDILQLLAAYREIVLRQGQWHDTGRRRPVRRSGRPRATRYRVLAAAHLDRYAGRRRPPGLQPHRRRARRRSAPTATWRWPGSRASCSLLALALARRSAWSLRARGSSAGRAPPAARASWLAATRPWRAARGRRSGCRALRPVAARRRARRRCCVATRAVQTSFLAAGAPARRARRVARAARRRLGAAASAAVAVAGHRRGRRRARAALRPGPARPVVRPAPAATGSRSGPSRRRRTVYVTVAVRAVPVAVRRGRAGRSSVTRSGAAGRPAPCSPPSGAGLAVPAAVDRRSSGSSGPSRPGTTRWGCCRGGSSRILGITVYLGIPADTAWWAAGLGAALLVVGLVLAVPGTRGRRLETGAEVAAGATT